MWRHNLLSHYSLIRKFTEKRLFSPLFIDKLHGNSQILGMPKQSNIMGLKWNLPIFVDLFTLNDYTVLPNEPSNSYGLR